MSLFTRLVGGYGGPPAPLPGKRNRPVQHTPKPVPRGFHLNEGGRPVCDTCGQPQGRCNRAMHQDFANQPRKVNVTYRGRNGSPWGRPEREKFHARDHLPSRSNGLIIIIILIVLLLLFVR